MLIFVTHHLHLILPLVLFFMLVFYVFFKHSTVSILEPSALYCISLSSQIAFFYCVAITQGLNLPFIIYITVFYFIFVSSNLFIDKRNVLMVHNIYKAHIITLVFFVFLQVLLIFVFWNIVSIPALELAKGNVRKLVFFRNSYIGYLLNLVLSSLSFIICFAVFLIYFEKRKTGTPSKHYLILLLPSIVYFLGGLSKTPFLELLFAIGLAIKKHKLPQNYKLLFFIILSAFFVTLFKISDKSLLERLLMLNVRLVGEGDLYYYLFAVDGNQLENLNVVSLWGRSMLHTALVRLGLAVPSPSLSGQLMYNLFGHNDYGPNSLAPVFGYLATGGYLGGILYAFYLSILHVFIARYFLKSQSIYSTLLFAFLYRHIFTLFRDTELFYSGPWRYVWPIMITFYIFSKFLLAFRKRSRRGLSVS